MPAASQPWFPIQTERLRLREFEVVDLDDVHTYASDINTVRFMEWGPNTEDVSRERLRLTIEEQAVWPRREVNLAVEVVEAKRVIGSMRLGFDGNAGGDVGYVFGSAWWRKGYAFEAASALLTTAFATLGLHRVWASCDVRNIASIALLEKLGMRREGTLLRDRKVRDGWRDTHLYALLSEEWGG